MIPKLQIGPFLFSAFKSPEDSHTAPKQPQPLPLRTHSPLCPWCSSTSCCFTSPGSAHAVSCAENPFSSCQLG